MTGRPGSRQANYRSRFGINASWVEHALCAEVGGDLWYPEPGGSVVPAKMICWSCPVREQCLEHALTHKETFGIWGGKTLHERHAMKRPVRLPNRCFRGHDLTVVGRHPTGRCKACQRDDNRRQVPRRRQRRHAGIS